MFNSKIFTPALVAIALSVAAGCTENTGQDPTVTQAPSPTTDIDETAQSPSPVQPGQTTLSASDQQFMTEAARGGLAEVQLGQLASQQGASDAVKQFGQRMVQDHTQANTQLQQLATQKGVALPTDMGNENQQIMQQLSQLSGADFDRAYMNHMVEDHVKDVSSFQQEAQQGQDPDVKAFAAQTVPILQEHLQLARSIADNTTPTNSPTPTPTNSP